MITIEVESEKIRIKKGVSSRTQKPYEIREQTVVAHGLGRFPVEVTIGLPDEVDGYPVGRYEVTTPLVPGRFGLEASRDLGLVAIKAASVKAA